MPSYSTTSRTSKVPPSYGARLSHSRASSIERTCHSQYPATSSLVSANGPSMTVRFLPSNRTPLLSAPGWGRPAGGDAARPGDHPGLEQFFVDLRVLRHSLRGWGIRRLALVAFLCQYQ